MKRLFSFAFIAITYIITSGCTDWLDIKPESEMVLEDFWQSESQVNSVVAACYRSFTEYDVMSRMLVWGELRSDNVTAGKSVPDEMSKMLNVDISPNNKFNHWGSFYTIINTCNTFLHYAPSVVDSDPNFTEAKLHALEAEILSLRALAYFYLVRTFKEVPYIDKPSIDDNQVYNVSKSSEEFILEKIVDDLLLALNYARDKFETPEYTKGRITKNAVRAILADVYLWQENYQACIQTCDQILDDTENRMELVEGEDVLSEVFYDGNSIESIFELQFDDINQDNKVLKEYYGHSGEMFGQWSFPVVFIYGVYSPFGFQAGAVKESVKDLRIKDFLFARVDKFYVFKYAGALRQETSAGFNYYIYRNTTANWIVYRLSEIMLMKAEALIQLESNNIQALDLINTVYLRSNPDLLGQGLNIQDYGSKLDMEKLLLRERQRELMFEGKRWFDLMRLAKRANSPTPLLSYVLKKYSGTASAQATKMSVMDALYLPIHSDELKANTELVQNPFYELTGEN
jgi:hypothetical protein